MKIRTKLITAFSIPFLIINGISASLISMQTTGRMQAQEIRNIEHAFSFIERELAFYDDSLSTSTDSAATMYMEESAASRNDEIREEWLLNTLKVNLQNIQKKLSVFGAVHVIHSDGTVLYSSVSDPPEDLIKLAAAQTAAEDESSGKKSGAVTVSRKYRENEEEYIFAASLSSSDRYLIIEMNKNELYADRRSFSFFMLVNVAAAELILILIFIFITGKFVTPITHVTKRFQVLARGRGDLSVRIPVKGKDETSDLANAFNTFSNKLREIIVSLKDQITFNSLTMGQFDTNIEKTVNQLGNMNDAVSEIDNEMKQIISRIQESFSAASEINKSADTIQQKAFGQNAAVEQSSASIEELVAAINNLASVADSRMKVIEDLNNSARKGQDRMNDTENSIAKISDSAGIIQELITVIDNIAQNTNLLAMNAAIEAAHAGEAGKGFSVVADEIRKLAENTQENSHNITENINSILETISSTQDVTKITGQAIDEIVDDVKNVYEGIKEIQSGLNEMASGTQEITSSIHMLSETSGALSDSTVDIHDKTGIIEQTLSSVSELAANTEKTVEAFMQSAKHVLELTRQMNKMGQNAVDNAGRMNDSVKQFKT